MSGPVIIVGASAAGVATAETLQRLAPEREVIIVGDEPTIAQDRPPLSKQVLEGIWGPERAELLPPVRRQNLKARLMLGRRATAVDVERRTLSVDDGVTLDFDELVIATGVRPRMLPGPRPGGVHVLRVLDDCEALRAAILRARDARLVVVGGGLIGMEAAATARKLGIAVTVIEPDREGLARRLGPSAAARLLDLHVGHGVEFRRGVGVSGYEVDADNQVSGVTLTDGSTIATDVVLVAIGCAPNVEWLSGTPLDISNGIKCDEYCRAAPGIWAAGDVASWYHAGLSRHIRVEHRINASEQGAAVAANIVGPLRKYIPTPFFWTDQYSARLQFAGEMCENAEETLDHVGEDASVHTFRVSGRLVAVLGWNAAKAIMPLRRELASHGRPEAP